MSEFPIPLVDRIAGGDAQADIYSMFRLRQGYVGACRRVRRASDNALLDVGFAASGAYDIERELAWAGTSDVYLVRWYNQSAAAGNGRPGYLAAADSPGAPRTRIAGGVVSVHGDPAIEMQSGSWLAPEPHIPIAAERTVSVVWIGCVGAGDGYDSGLWSIHEEGIDDARTCEVDGFDRSLIRDRGIGYGRAALYTRADGDFSAPSLIVAVHQVVSPWQTIAWVNGGVRPVSYQGSVGGIGVGAAQLLGPNRVHTFIVDAATESTIAAAVVGQYELRS